MSNKVDETENIYKELVELRKQIEFLFYLKIFQHFCNLTFFLSESLSSK